MKKCPCQTMREIAYELPNDKEVVLSFRENEVMYDNFQYRYKLFCIKYCPLCGRDLRKDEQLKIEGL